MSRTRFRVKSFFHSNIQSNFYITKISNKREPQGIALNHSSDTDPRKFMNIYRECTKEPYYLFVNETTVQSDSVF